MPSIEPLSPTLPPPPLAHLNFYSWIIGGGGHKESTVLVTLNLPTASSW